MWIEFDAAAERRKREHERDTILAYQAVRIYVKTMNEKRMPSLRDLIEPNRQQTAAERRSAIRLIAAQFGLHERPRVRDGR